LAYNVNMFRFSNGLCVYSYMSKLPKNIKQLNKFSLKEVKLPAPKERELIPFIPTKVEVKTINKADVFYNKIIETYPNFKELVDTFDLKIESFNKTVIQINRVI
jgi:hypothetical protein